MAPKGKGTWVTGLSMPIGSVPRSSYGEQQARNALAQDIAQFGDNSMPVLISKNNLAVCLADSNPQEAEKLHREILEQKLKQFPKGHPSIGITQNGLGSVLKAQGKYEEAITFLEEALKLREPLTGHGKDAAITRDEIGVCLQGVGRHAEAKAMRLRKGKEQMVCSNEPCSRTPREARVQELRACGRCGSIFYCSEECQRADWKSHKKVCKPKEEGTSHASA